MTATDRRLGSSRLLRLFWLSLLFLPLLAQAAATQVKGVRLWAAPDSTRVVFDVSGPVSHRLFTLKNPNRLVIDLTRTGIDSTVKQSFTKGGMVTVELSRLG